MEIRANQLINNFNSGELGPLIEARSDLEKYGSGCKTLENAVPLVEGGAKKMPGTYYAGAAKSGSVPCRLVPFAFSTIDNYVLEFGDKYIRFWKNGGQVVSYIATIVAYLRNDSAFVDSSESAHVVTAEGDISIDNSVYKVGIGSAKFGNGGGLLTMPDSDDWHMDTGAFTVALWARFSFLGATRGLFCQHSSETDWWGLDWDIIGQQLRFRIVASSITEVELLGDFVPVLDTWYHIAVVRGWGGDDTVIALLVNRVAIATVTTSQPVANYTSPFYIGYGNVVAGPGFNTFTGWIDEVIVAQGALWEEDGSVTDTDPEIEEVYEITTPYNQVHLFELDVNTQSADVLYIFHHLYPPMTLSRTAETSWSLAELGATGTGDVAKQSNGIAKIITGASKAAACVITCIAHGFSSDDEVYINGIVGMVELNWGVYTITKLTDNTFSIPIDSTGFLSYSSGGYAAKVIDLFAAAGDYPSCGTFYEQRLIAAGPDNNPQRVKGSVQADFPDFICDPNQDDYAIQYDLVSTKIDQLRWAIGCPTALILGTVGGLWSMFTSQGTPLTQTNVNAYKQGTIGVGNIAPQLVDDTVIWVSREGKQVRFMVYNFVTNKWENLNLTRLNRQITQGATKATSGIVQTAFQVEPYPIFWAVRKDGQLIGLTFERQEQVYAWFRIATDGDIESIAVISKDNEEDQVWVSVRRTFNDADVRTIEYFMPHEIYSDLANAFFVHCGLQWNGGPSMDITAATQADPCEIEVMNHGFQTGWKVQITGITGMTELNQDPSEAYTITVIDDDHFTLDTMDSTEFTAYVSGGTVKRVTNQVTGMSYLLGKDVVAVGDGAVIYDGAVDADTLSFDYYSNLITVGLPFTTIIEPMNPTLNAQGLTTRGMKQKIKRVTMCFHETVGGQYGSSVDKLYEIPELRTGESNELFTGDITKELLSDWKDEATIVIVHDEPFPFTLKGVIPRFEANEI